MKRTLNRAGLLVVLAGAVAGCSTMQGLGLGGDSKADSKAAAPAPAAAAAPAASKIGPGMNAAGDVIDSRKVEAGYGTKVKGLDDWEGEITGRLAPGSKFGELKIGMTSAKVLKLLGAPDDQGAHATGKAWIPFYFGSDRYRYEVVYKGQGRLLFAGGAGFGWDSKTHLIWIINSANESGDL